ncbi:MAG: DUF924 domain-containing protein [Deltaproteobacteria bacterium]|nr:DUF924 domain-containing protein [Deltaproteobacteria bacterium]
MEGFDFQLVIDFWFHEIAPASRWKKDPSFDALIRKRFLSFHTAAAGGELFHWREEPEGRLAEIIILDQFSRNIFRGKPASFLYDSMSLILAQEALAAGIDSALPPDKKAFIYMPFMHSESALIHEIALKLFSQPGLESNLDWEIKHKAVIDRFGRYPHRNEILGRKSTTEELAFLAQRGSSF